MGRHELEEHLAPKSLVGIYLGSMWNEDVSYGLFTFDEQGTRSVVMKVWVIWRGEYSSRIYVVGHRMP